jgi:hypothetical protein
MKKSTLLKLAVAIILIVTAISPAVVFGDGSDPWVAGIQVANLDTQPATVTIEFYNTAGTLVYTYADPTPIPAGGARTYYVPAILPDTAATSFRGSAVVSSERNIAAIVNENAGSGANYDQPPGILRGSYTGIRAAETASTLYIPVAVKAYYSFNSQLVVQNAGATANINFEFFNQAGASIATYVASSVAANASAILDLDTLTPTTGSIPSGFNGSVKVTSSSNLAAMVNNNDGKVLQTYNAFTPGNGGTTLYVPGVYNAYYGYVSSVQVQNVGTVATNITVTYSDGIVKTANGVAPGSSALFYQPTEGHASGWSGSATITSSAANVVAVVNQLMPGVKASSYNAASGGATQIVAPALFKAFYGYDTALTVMNVGTVATNISVSYSDGLSASATNVQPGKSAQFFQFLEGHASGWSGAATITSSAASVMGVVNEENRAKTDGDWQYSYNCLAP